MNNTCCGSRLCHAFRPGMLGEPRRGWKVEQGEETWEASRVPGEEKDEVSTRPDYVVLFGDDGNTGREEYENLKVNDWLDR